MLLSYAPLRMFRFIANYLENEEALKLVNTHSESVCRFLEFNLINLINQVQTTIKKTRNK